MKARLNVATENGICTSTYKEYNTEEFKIFKAWCILAANGGLDYMELTDTIGTVIIIPKKILINSVFTIEQKIIK